MSVLDLQAFAASMKVAPLSEALDTLLQMGMPLPAPLFGDVTPLPENLSDLAVDDYGLHLSQWSQLTSYAWAQHAAACVVRDSTQDDYDEAYSKALARFAGSSTASVTAQKSKAEADPSVLAAKRHLRKAEALVELLAKLASGYDRNYQAVSRQVTVMEAEARLTGNRRS